ncbi:MAG: hypothetical protein A2075_01180 [Geobacteraceae bacterium GWC2_58_44]|nr:MAG: hypothetical protein A2075_01180 [Geobacteraceae bacterium GWC2_58_44]
MKVPGRETRRIDLAIGYGFRAAVVSVALLFSGCGGGGGGSAPAAVNSVTPASPQAPQAENSFAITSDNYGIGNATYLAATTSTSGLVLRAAIASSMTDQEFKTVSRIDIANPGAVAAGVAYSLGGAAGGAPAFPGTVYFFNGHPSTLLQTAGGSIIFTSYGSNPGDPVSGSFTALVVDGSDSATPKASYTIAANFSFTTGSFGPILPAPVPVPLVASATYGAICASCHTLGSLDSVPGSGPELSLKGGRLNTLFGAGVAGHQGITLADAEISAVKILLNMN